LALARNRTAITQFGLNSYVARPAYTTTPWSVCCCPSSIWANRWSTPTTAATPVVDRSTQTCLEPR